MGCATWPDEPTYERCPECDQPTRASDRFEPMDTDEAESVLRHKAFERYVAKRDADRGFTADELPPAKYLVVAVALDPDTP